MRTEHLIKPRWIAVGGKGVEKVRRRRGLEVSSLLWRGEEAVDLCDRDSLTLQVSEYVFY